MDTIQTYAIENMQGTIVQLKCNLLEYSAYHLKKNRQFYIHSLREREITFIYYIHFILFNDKSVPSITLYADNLFSSISSNEKKNKKMQFTFLSFPVYALHQIEFYTIIFF